MASPSPRRPAGRPRLPRSGSRRRQPRAGRQRVLVRRPDVDEMDVEAVDLRGELRQRVQPRLEPPEVVLGARVAHQLLHRRELYALRRVTVSLRATASPGPDLGCAFDGCHVDLHSSGCWVDPRLSRPSRYGEAATTKFHFLKVRGCWSTRFTRSPQVQIIEPVHVRETANEPKQNPLSPAPVQQGRVTRRRATRSIDWSGPASYVNQIRAVLP